MLLGMTSRMRRAGTVPARKRWGPTWAKILVVVSLAPAAISFFLGVAFFIQGFGDDALAAVGFIVGPVLALLALVIAVPAVLFLSLRGKPLFITTMCTTGLLLVIVILYGF